MRIRGQPAPGPPGPPDSDNSSSDSDADGHNNGPLFPPPGNNPPPIRLPPGGRVYAEPIQIHYLGPMNIQCPECRALHFDCEKLSKSTRARKRFGICCLEGKVQLPALPQWPQELQRLYENNRDFVHNIRQYNNTFAFTSLGVEVDRHTVQGPGPAAFRIHGGLYHLMGSLLPRENEVPSFAQLYIHDPHEAVAIRQQRNGNLNADVLRELNDMLFNHHPYVQVFKHAHQILNARPEANQSDLRVRLHYNEATDARRYNLPTANEIAAVIPGDGTEVLNENRDIILRLEGGGLRRISHLHRAYSTLHYVLLFPKGEHGWHLGMELQQNQGRQNQSKHLTQILYYAYRIHIRPQEIEPRNLFHGARLFQQYICDAWTSVEQSNLTWIVHNQRQIRADLYSGLRDRVAQDPNVNLQDTGRSIVLPSSHSGSPRYMQQLLQDSLAICRDCQKPDLFLTMTANANWQEISENLLPGMFISFIFSNLI